MAKSKTKKQKSPERGPEGPLPENVREQLNALGRSLESNFSGVSDRSGELRRVIYRDYGNILPVLFRCASHIGMDTLRMFPEGERAHLNEQLGCFASNWLDAWRDHVADGGAWRAMFMDMSDRGVNGTRDERLAWLVMAEALLRLTVLLPVHVDMLGAMSIPDVGQGACERAYAATIMGSVPLDKRRELLAEMVATGCLGADDGLKRGCLPVSGKRLRLAGLRRGLALVLRRLADRLSGRELLDKKLKGGSDARS